MEVTQNNDVSLSWAAEHHSWALQTVNPPPTKWLQYWCNILLHNPHVSHTFTSIESIKLAVDDALPATQYPAFAWVIFTQLWRTVFQPLRFPSWKRRGGEETWLPAPWRQRQMFYGPLLKQSPSFKAMKCENLSEPRASHSTEGLK